MKRIEILKAIGALAAQREERLALLGLPMFGDNPKLRAEVEAELKEIDAQADKLSEQLKGAKL